MEIADLIPPAKDIPKLAPDVNDKKQSILQDLLDRVLTASKEPEVKPAKKKFEFATKKDTSWTKYFYSGKGDQLQISHMTSQNRFPKIMESAKKLKPDAKKLLSFGCSTGEECQSLLEYFPNAEQIIGVDLDYSSISMARRKNKSDKVLFTDEIDVLGKFDVITVLQTLFCLEVPVPKVRWLKAIEKIDEHIAPGGIIMIYTSDYDPVEVLTNDRYEYVNLWLREHNKKPGSQYYNGYYRRRNTDEQNTSG